MEIREAKASDAEAIAAIYNEGIADRATLETEPRSAQEPAAWLESRDDWCWLPTNPAGLRLYASRGFREVGVYREQGRLDGRWVDVVIMEKLLA